MLDYYLILSSVMWGMALVGTLLAGNRPMSATIATLNLIATLTLLTVPGVR